MKKLIVKAFKILVGAIAAHAICIWADSKFLIEFLEGGIVGLLVTLIAINTATCCFTVGKLHDISVNKKIDVTDIYIEIRRSIKYQIWLIVFAIVILTIESSTTIDLDSQDPNYKMVLDTLLIFVFISAIEILRDTGTAMFDILISSAPKP